MSVSFATPQSGWAAGWNGAVLHTEDGGSHWQVQPIAGAAKLLHLVSFATPKSGWAVGWGTILYTEDGGVTNGFQKMTSKQRSSRRAAPFGALPLV